MKLVKYDCGCIGFPPMSDGSSVLISVCDRDCFGDYSGAFSTRKMNSRAYEELHEELCKEHADKLASLIDDGYAMRTVRSLVERKSS